MITYNVRDPEQCRGVANVLIVSAPGYTLTKEDMEKIERGWIDSDMDEQSLPIKRNRSTVQLPIETLTGN